MNSPLRIEIVEAHSLHELPTSAATLLDTQEGVRVGFGRDWYQLLISSVLVDHKGVRFYCLVNEEEARVVLPLIKHADGTASALSNFYTTLYAPALAQNCTRQELAEVVRYVISAGGSIRKFQLGPMDPTWREFRLLKEAFEELGMPSFGYFAHGNWYLPSEGDWESYLAARPGNLRTTIKRMKKRIERENGRIEIITSGDRLEAGIAAYVSIYNNSWKTKEPFQDFMPGLMRLCAQRGWLRLGLVWINDAPAAAQVWIIAGGRAEIYKLAYDEQYKSLSPGTVLTAFMMQQAMEKDHVHEFDYLIGDDPYKAQWMTHRRERWGLVAYNLRTVGGFMGWLREVAGRQVKRWRRQAPAV